MWILARSIEGHSASVSPPPMQIDHRYLIHPYNMAAGIRGFIGDVNI